jgi:hypothetical protein
VSRTAGPSMHMAASASFVGHRKASSNIEGRRGWREAGRMLWGKRCGATDPASRAAWGEPAVACPAQARRVELRPGSGASSREHCAQPGSSQDAVRQERHNAWSHARARSNSCVRRVFCRCLDPGHPARGDTGLHQTRTVLWSEASCSGSSLAGGSCSVPVALPQVSVTSTPTILTRCPHACCSFLGR